MKKKAIEKIPYIGLRSVSRKKGAKYIGATAVKIIGHEKHLFLEVYRNRKEDLAVPVVRIVLTKKDFGTYFPEEGRWSRRLISEGYYTGLTWDHCVDYHNREKENVLRSDEDLQRIKRFPGVGTPTWGKWTWWEYVNRRMNTIAIQERRQRENRRYERRQQALEDRMENTPELPEARVLEYADQEIFHEQHYLFYKKHGVRARVACSKCGGTEDWRWKPGTSYESQFEKVIEKPKEGGYGTCPLCGARGEWKPQGKVKGTCRETAFLFLGQKYRGRGMVFRYIEVTKKHQVGFAREDEGLVMENAREVVSGTEIARAYFEEGKDVQIDYHKNNHYKGEDFWDDCNLYGLANIQIREAKIMRETYENMRGTFLQYSAMREYESAVDGYIDPIKYAERYMDTPQVEMLVKLGLTKVVEEMVRYGYDMGTDKNADRLDTFLGIRKEHIRQLIRHHGEKRLLRVMRTEKQTGQRWSDQQIECLAEIDVGMMNGWTEALEHMGVQKILNIIAKYAGAEYGTGCSRAESRLNATALTYFDYLHMRQVLGYDMSNTVYLAPRDLNEAHQKMVEERNKAKADLRIREVQAKFPLIKKCYRRLRKKFYYEEGGFLIRPARDAGEIVEEGRILHHCVGGDNYLKKHNEGVTTILFLRSVKNPEIPYITVEIETEGMRIVQWYGAHDKKPDEKYVGRWLDTYVTKLRCGLIGAQDGTEEIRQQALLMPA